MDSIFSIYNSVEPPEGYLDQELPTINYTPMVTTPPDIQEEPQVVYQQPVDPYMSPFDMFDFENPEPVEKEKDFSGQQNQVVNLARQFLGKPYVWGSTDPDKGFDCSGLVWYVYKQMGVDLPRTSHAMGKIGTEVQLNSAQPGDIIYSTGKGPSGGHIKMVSKVQDGKIFVIEAKGRRQGIVEHELTYTKNIRSIRRILAPEKTEEQNTDTVEVKSTNTGKFNNHKDFTNALVGTYKQVLKEAGLDPNYAYALTASAALESGWGTKVSGTYNYGGVKAKKGSTKSTIDYVNGRYIRRNQVFRDFKSVKDYCNYMVNTLLSNSRYRAFATYPASKPMEFWRHVLDAGYGGGDTAGKNRYMNAFSKIYNMIRYGK